MAKTSKRKPAPAPVRATKTRLTKDMRSTLHRFMVDEFRKRIDRTALDKTRDALVERANAILRAKYPEEDMPVLRKYEMTRVDSCLKFTVLEKQRVFGVSFNPYNLHLGEAAIIDIPCLRGCYNHEVYPCDKDFEALADKWDKQINERTEIIGAKEIEYNGFLLACRYLEEVEAVVPLTEEIRKSIGAQGRALTILNPDVLKRIKSDFAQEIAA
jgi:hypothetical protein